MHTVGGGIFTPTKQESTQVPTPRRRRNAAAALPHRPLYWSLSATRPGTWVSGYGRSLAFYAWLVPRFCLPTRRSQQWGCGWPRWFLTLLMLAVVCACSAVPQPPTPPPGPSAPAPSGVTPTAAAPTGGQPGEKSRPAEKPIRARAIVASLPTLPHALAVQLAEYRIVDPDLHLDVVVPQLKHAPALNRQLRQVADSSVQSFRRTVRREADRGPSRYHAMSVGWQLLARSDTTTGIQLWVAQQHGLQVKIERVTVWYDHSSHNVLSLRDLFAPAAWPAAQRAVLGALRQHSDRPAAVKAALAARGRPQGKGPTFGFAADGSLVVTFAAQTRSPNGTPASVRLAPGPLQSRLSQAGRSASVSSPRIPDRRCRSRAGGLPYP